MVSYLLLIFCVITYLLSFSKTAIAHTQLKTSASFTFIVGIDFFAISFFFAALLFVTASAWNSPAQFAWFGNILFSALQLKIFYLALFFFVLVSAPYATSFYFTSKNSFDYPIVVFNFFYWTTLLFFSNNLFVFVFFLEILSTLILLLVITSVFSSNSFYNNLNLNLHHYFNSSTPLFFVQILIFFFWV